MIKKGTRVLIYNKNYTQQTVGVSPRMEKMVGNTYIVDEIKNTHQVYIRDNYGGKWIWSIKDLKAVRVRRSQIKPELFNPDNLI